MKLRLPDGRFRLELDDKGHRAAQSAAVAPGARARIALAWE